MLECLIIGDSIAVGTKMFAPQCAEYAKGGITSHGWNKKFGNNNLSADSVIISLGTNDWEKADTYGTLMNIRSKVKAKRVFWILPNQEVKPKAYNEVTRVADQFGDTVIGTNRYQPDKIHPSWAGYKELVSKTK